MPAAVRYTAVAIALHWTIAAAIVANFLLGWWMHQAIDVAQTQARAIAAFQLHKSLGLTILALSLARLAWRWWHAPPPLPAAMPGWEKLAARLTHWAFYALMIGLPLSGWLYVSTQWRGNHPLNVPTLWFGLIEVPHLLGLHEMTRELRQSYAGLTLQAHELLAWSMGALLVLHVAAALKHHFVNRDEVLAHMLPGPRVFTAGLGVILIAVLALAWTLTRTPGTTGAVAAITSNPASNWIVDPARSEVKFSGLHAGLPFQGRFTRWQADIRFTPADLEHSQIGGTFETASATDGVPLHDESLSLAEWFNVTRHPLATFRSTRITADGAGAYAVDGVLTIKGHELTLPPLTLSIEGELARISGRFEVDRREADLGMESDPDAQYVSRKIVVEIRVEARRRP
ncbi:MAG: cytochrome b/b6 domain-containing protein [Nevskiales bacterium]